MKRMMILLVVAGVLASATTSDAGQPDAFKSMNTQTYRIVKVSGTESSPYGTILTVQQDLPELPTGDGQNGQAAEPAPLLMPEGHPAPQGHLMPTETVQLFPYVKYEDPENVHPCAVTKIVAVPDPCARCRHHGRHRCAQCRPSCVYVRICVPPCGCPKVKVKHHGRKIEYDYGEYEVEIESKNGVIEVDYDDGLFAKLF